VLLQLCDNRLLNLSCPQDELTADYIMSTLHNTIKRSAGRWCGECWVSFRLSAIIGLIYLKLPPQKILREKDSIN